MNYVNKLLNALGESSKLKFDEYSKKHKNHIFPECIVRIAFFVQFECVNLVVSLLP